MTIMIDVKLASSMKVWDFSDPHEKFVPAVLCIVSTRTCTGRYILVYLPL